jgi:hypothetical protein
MPSAMIFHPFLIELNNCSIIVISVYIVNLGLSLFDLPHGLQFIYKRVLLSGNHGLMKIETGYSES